MKTLTKKIALASILGVTLSANSALAADNTWTPPEDTLHKLYPKGVGKRDFGIKHKVEYTHSSTNNSEWTPPRDLLSELYPKGVGKRDFGIKQKVEYTHSNTSNSDWTPPRDLLAELF